MKNDSCAPDPPRAPQSIARCLGGGALASVVDILAGGTGVPPSSSAGASAAVGGSSPAGEAAGGAAAGGGGGLGLDTSGLPDLLLWREAAGRPPAAKLVEVKVMRERRK